MRRLCWHACSLQKVTEHLRMLSATYLGFWQVSKRRLGRQAACMHAQRLGLAYSHLRSSERLIGVAGQIRACIAAGGCADLAIVLC